MREVQSPAVTVSAADGGSVTLRFDSSAAASAFVDAAKQSLSVVEIALTFSGDPPRPPGPFDGRSSFTPAPR